MNRTFKPLAIILLILAPWIAGAQQAMPSCGTNDSLAASYLQKISQHTDLTQARTHAGEMLEYRIAVNIDYKTATLYGQDQGKIRKVVYKMFADASAIYEREMNIKLTVTYIHIWQEPEPYTLVYPYDYFSKVQEYWNQNRKEERDAVVGMTTQISLFYGGYRMATAHLPTPNTTSDPGVLAHELGHSLGSPHTHSCNWPGGPIDYCEELESTSETCPPSSKENLNSTIMSYCRTKLTFHPLCRNLIREFAEGKVDPSFSLKPFIQKPAAPGPLKVLTKPGDPYDFAPYFEWSAPERASKFRFQIATDEAFTQIIEDTVVNQAFYHSPGQNDGNYFARFQAENNHGESGWSPSSAFSISSWKNSMSPPQLTDVTRTSGGLISGSFRNLEGISSYQMQVQLPLTDEMHEVTGQPDNTQTQHFSFLLPLKRERYYAMKFRVNKQGTWTDWSQWTELHPTEFTTHFLPDTIMPLSTRPVLALKQWVPTIPGIVDTEAVTGQLQIATDTSFKNIVFQQPFSNNLASDWVTDKTVFIPSLEENTSYYARSRILLSGRAPSGWQTSRFTTGLHDNRFNFLGIPSDALKTASNANTEVLYNRFLKAGDHLYVFNFNGGYHHTTDLQTWKTYMPSTTKGQSPMHLIAFGASGDGQTFVVDYMKNLAVQQYNDAFVKSTPNTTIHWGYIQAMIHTEKDGYFLKNSGHGVVQIKDTTWVHHTNPPYLSQPASLAKDNQERVWVVSEEGRTGYYENGQWINQPNLPSPGTINGMTFDAKGNCYVYGSFGVSVLNAGSRSWNAIQALQTFSVKKIVFDGNGNMWLASWKNRWDDPTLENYALVKFAGGKASVYSDGLNFLREQFDIEYFKDKLLIMTTGGEIHSFDERQILTFEPEPSYPAGSAITVKLSSNSTFEANNDITIELNNTTTGQKITVSETTLNGHLVSFKLPDTLGDGQYTLKLLTTAPEIISYDSHPFRVVPVNAPTTEHPDEVTLLQNIPNPATGPTEIGFYLPQAAEAKVELFTAHGQFIRQLANNSFPAGWNIVQTDLTGLRSGLYVYRLTMGSIVKSKILIH